MDELKHMHDTARNEFLNRAKAQSRTLSDVFILKSIFNPVMSDPKVVAAARAVAPFFRSLDSIAVYNDEAKTIVWRYRGYLYKVEQKGISSFADFKSFMREEDRLFRSFMNRFSDLGGTSVTDITKRTERIYSKSLQHLVSQNVGVDTLSMMMAMRANRRLLINAETCARDIKAGKVKDTSHQEAYSWMILQPFLNINEMGYAALSDNEKQRFAKLAKEAPSVVKGIENRLKIKDSTIDKLPDLIIKVYISSL